MDPVAATPVRVPQDAAGEGRLREREVLAPKLGRDLLAVDPPLLEGSLVHRGLVGLAPREHRASADLGFAGLAEREELADLVVRDVVAPNDGAGGGVGRGGNGGGRVVGGHGTFLQRKTCQVDRELV